MMPVKSVSAQDSQEEPPALREILHHLLEGGQTRRFPREHGPAAALRGDKSCKVLRAASPGVRHHAEEAGRRQVGPAGGQDEGVEELTKTHGQANTDAPANRAGQKDLLKDKSLLCPTLKDFYFIWMFYFNEGWKKIKIKDLND